ncbi:MAG: RNA polymerase-associated protein RapA [bacterium]|nr:RNA polymerase-associated protein RapA [bacterium]
MDSKFQRGDEVRLSNRRDQIGVIISEPQFQGGEYWYRIRFHQDANTYPESALEKFDGANDPLSLFRQGVYSTKESFSKLMTYNKIKVPLRNTIYAYQASRIELLPYQYKPLLKFLDSDNQRILVADEVGLGKTIEAGLILSELRQRTILRRVLIVCRAQLRYKWRWEMHDKFQEDFRILDAQGIREFIAELAERGDLTELRAICSLESLRNRRMMEELNEIGVDFDLVIIDEAQHLRNPETKNNRLGRWLNEASGAMILLSATPVNIGNEDLFHLLQILDPNEFNSLEAFRKRIRENEPLVKAERLVRTRNQQKIREAKQILLGYKQKRNDLLATETKLLDRIVSRLNEIEPNNASSLIGTQRDLNRLNTFSHILTRTRKREVMEKAPVRLARVIRLEWSEGEAKFYRLVTNYVIRRQRSGEWGAFAAFMTMMPQRQVASCIPAMIEYYRERIKLDQPNTQVQQDKAGDNEADIYSSEAGIELGKSECDDHDLDANVAKNAMRHIQQELYAEMHNLLAEPIPDTKFEKLLSDVLRPLDDEEPGRKIIIFSYFKKTLEYLSKCLDEQGYSNAIISGDYDEATRLERINRFRHPEGPRILLSSEIGSEGLDFQFCHIMVNYDLPWNPMVVEQRIGRLDRHGQLSERILIFNFSINGTIEQKILERLYQRIGIFESSIGDLEPILGPEMKTLQRELLSSHLTPEEIENRIEQEATIIEKNRQELLELEQESAKFVGQGEFFDEEIKRIKEQRRFITPEELVTFIQEFLKDHLPRVGLQKVANQLFELKPSRQLEAFLRQYVIEEYHDHVFLKFLEEIRKDKTRLTFDAATAFRNVALEFVNWHHPLIRAIVRYYDNRKDELAPVSRLAIQSDLAPVGDYLFVIYSWSIIGANHMQRTDAVFMPLQGHNPLDETISEKLLALLISEGKTLEGIPKLDPKFLVTRTNAIREQFLGILARHKTDFVERNDAVLDKRLNSLRDTWRILKAQIEQKLQELKSKDSPVGQITRLENKLRYHSAEFEKKEEEITQRRKVSESFDEIAAGFLRII